MDISNRRNQTQASQANSDSSFKEPEPAKSYNNRSKDKGMWTRIGIAAGVASIVILIVAVILLIAAGGSNNSSEAKYINNSKLQVVALNNGQAYFGNITRINDKYLVLTNIYYLQQTTTGANNNNATPNLTLVKLGCEIHMPYDMLVINRDQVTFWENLQDNGKVAKAVAAFKQANPSGEQKCVDQSSTSSNNSVSNTQNAAPSNASTQNSTSNTNNSATTSR